MDSPDIVSTTIEEVRSDREVDRTHVLARLEDWCKRVHELFHVIESALGREFTYDRTGKWGSQEEMVQRAGLTQDQVPLVDVLRIEKPQGSMRALILPRGLWIVGANGRLDLRVFYPMPRQYLIADRSQPLANKPEWYLIAVGDPLAPHLLTNDVIRSVIGAGL
ncbi:hypothetical protein [Methylovirgula sp. HY1]|uniref:hypothetical protein n=1 Tax=Methylovirgula sp. HY1 TaxID=2822761 RepID=UPI001C5BF92A|nr:hypothetical protein [Methylovirgula sp. HY1]QXX73936.1 hypothetical protein MHY1_00737 [Methylovirgula sp. HY1]